MNEIIKIFKGGRANGKTMTMILDLENRLRFLCPDDAEKIIRLVKENTTVYEVLQVLNNIVNAAALGADFSKCNDLEEIRRECWRVFGKKFFER